MNEIKVKVNFAKKTLIKTGTDLTVNDYNSTKLVFDFDRQDGTKILEMINPSGELVLLENIKDNEVILTGKTEDGKDASLFTEEGQYIFEISLYEENSKLTSASGKLRVRAEQVEINGQVVTQYLPVFDELLSKVKESLEEVELLKETVIYDCTTASEKAKEVSDKAEAAAKSATDSAERANSVIDQAEQAIGEIESTVQDIEKSKEEMEQAIQGKVSEMESVITTNTTNLENSINDKTTALEEAINRKANELSTSIESKTTALEETLNTTKDLQKQVKDNNDSLTEQITKSNEELTEQITQSNQALTSQITEATQNLTNQIEESRTQLETEIGERIAQITTLSVDVVEQLPTENISPTTIYLIKPENLPQDVQAQSISKNIAKNTMVISPLNTNDVRTIATTGVGEENFYLACFYVKEKWTIVGSTTTDLTPYAKTVDVEKSINSAKTEINGNIDTKLAEYKKSTDITSEITSAVDSAKQEVKAEIPTSTEDLTNDSGFITSNDIPKNISTFTNDSGYITSKDIPTNLSSFTNDSGFITSGAIPTNVSAFTNDAGYLKSFTESDPTVPSHVKSISSANITSWNNKAEKSAIPTKLSQLTDDLLIQASSESNAKSLSTSNPGKYYYTLE